ncbi:hypothetical protein CLOP_g8065 [Closterium sp. NIES-67]|nr:hypothetical protein CLOP_g8065 [Closterium sp. NIES-67]
MGRVALESPWDAPNLIRFGGATATRLWKFMEGHVLPSLRDELRPGVRMRFGGGDSRAGGASRLDVRGERGKRVGRCGLMMHGVQMGRMRWEEMRMRKRTTRRMRMKRKRKGRTMRTMRGDEDEEDENDVDDDGDEDWEEDEESGI